MFLPGVIGSGKICISGEEVFVMKKIVDISHNGPVPARQDLSQLSSMRTW